MNRQTDKKQAGKLPSKEFAGAGARARGTRATILEDEVRAEREKFLSMPLDKKRKLYRCGDDRCLTLKDIPRWPEYPLESKKGPASPRKVSKTSSRAPKYTVSQEVNQRVSLFRGDITALEIDAIVNAANSSLLGGGGVDGAIHGAAGPFLKKECSLLHGCDTGEAKITCGYKLPAKYVIHTVGPMGEKPAVLEKAYRRSLEVLQQSQLTSVAFPCISTGIYGYPPESAAHVALATVRQWLQQEAYSDKVERVIFCVFLKKDVEIYEELMPLYFPLAPAPASPATGDTHSTHGGETATGQLGDSGRDGQVSADGQTEAEMSSPKNAALTTEGCGDEQPESNTSPTDRKGAAPEGEESMEKEATEEKEEEEGKNSQRKSKGEQKDGKQEQKAVEGKIATKL